MPEIRQAWPAVARVNRRPADAPKDVEGEGREGEDERVRLAVPARKPLDDEVEPAALDGGADLVVQLEASRERVARVVAGVDAEKDSVLSQRWGREGHRTQYPRRLASRALVSPPVCQRHDAGRVGYGFASAKESVHPQPCDNTNNLAFCAKHFFIEIHFRCISNRQRKRKSS